MRKVIPFNEFLKVEIIPKLRALYFGTSATAQEYKDSFIINEAVDRFKTEYVDSLMSEDISQIESLEKPFVKTVNYRASSFFKISSISESLGISHAEACRRVLYFSASNAPLEEETAPNNNYSTHEHELTQLKAKLVLLQGYMKNLNKEVQRVQEVIDEISNEIFKEGKNF